VVGELLAARGLTIATAESCTGGLLASRITDIPGSSDYFDRGLVTYSNAAKTELLGVPAETLAEHGAVSEPVALAMAEGVRRIAGADLGLGITGVAGPAGGTPEKPVGLVWIALAHAGGAEARRFKLFGDRERIRVFSATVALNWVRTHLLGVPWSGSLR
jgi:PncC family amidohydrolase